MFKVVVSLNSRSSFKDFITIITIVTTIMMMILVMGIIVVISMTSVMIMQIGSMLVLVIMSVVITMTMIIMILWCSKDKGEVCYTLYKVGSGQERRVQSTVMSENREDCVGSGRPPTEPQ